MSIEMRKARAKVLKRILNSLTVEIAELKARGETETEELENARNAITKFCDRLWPFSMDSTRIRHSSHGRRSQHLHSHPMMRAA